MNYNDKHSFTELFSSKQFLSKSDKLLSFRVFFKNTEQNDASVFIIITWWFVWTSQHKQQQIRTTRSLLN